MVLRHHVPVLEPLACGCRPLQPSVARIEHCGWHPATGPDTVRRVSSCSNCGGQISPGGRFCKNCGTPTSSAEPVPPSASVVTQGVATGSSPMVQSGQVHPYHSVPQPQKPLWRNPISLAVAGVVFIAIVGAVLILIRPSSSAQSTASTAVAYLQAGNWAKFCTLVEPAERTNCNVAIKEQTGSAYPKLVLASVTTSGDQATATVTCRGASYCTRFTGSNATATGQGEWHLVPRR